MEIKQIIDQQIAQDEKNGFPVKFSDEKSKFEQLTKDLVGFFGEIGEFSNIVKKINIKIDKGDKFNFNMVEAEQALHEELVDSFIYLIRLAAIINVDLEAEFIKKMQLNATRHGMADGR